MNDDTASGASRAVRLTALLADAPKPDDHDGVREYLHALAAAGLWVLLICPGTKVPFDGRVVRKRNADDRAARAEAKAAGRRNWQGVKSPAGVYLATADTATLDGYLDHYVTTFGAKYPDGVPVNVAVSVGRSRLVVIDCDTAEQVAAFLADRGALEDGRPTVRSPGACTEAGEWVHSDGGHFWFTVPEGVDLPAGVDSISVGAGDDAYSVFWGRGRYVLTPPSVRAEGSYSATGDVHPLPDSLRGRIIERAPVARRVADRSVVTAASRSTLIDEWSRSINWGEILGPVGWTPTGRIDSCGCETWTAPGEHASPKSATAHEPGCAEPRYDTDNPPLHIWTDNPGQPMAAYVAAHGKTLSKLQAVAWIDFDDDTGAAMEALDLHAETTTLTAGPGAGRGNDSAPADGPRATNTGRVIRLRSMSEIVDDAPTWAWDYDGYGRIMRGTLVILGGRPAAGKSTAARWFAAGFSQGTVDGCFRGQPQTVAYVGTEESYEYLVKPGLRAVGADMDRVKQVIVEKGDHETRLLAADDEHALTAEFIAQGVTVVIVDPLMSTIDGKTDIYRNNETREVLEPWARIAQAINGVVLGIAHLVKAPNGDVLAAIQGSSAFGEVARGVFGFAKDDKSTEDGGGARIMSQVKNSAGREDLSVVYRVIDTEVVTDTGKAANVGRFEISGTSDRTVADVMRDQARNGGASRGAGAEVGMWMGKYLAGGPRWAAQGYEDAERVGFSKDQVKRGRRACGIEALKAKGAEGRWYWVTAEQADADQTPDVAPSADVTVVLSTQLGGAPGRELFPGP